MPKYIWSVKKNFRPASGASAPEPKEFERAVQFERDLQHAKSQTDNQRGKPFLHNSLKPLDTVDLTTDIERGQGEMFGNDCTGLCGV